MAGTKPMLNIAGKPILFNKVFQKRDKIKDLVQQVLYL